MELKDKSYLDKFETTVNHALIRYLLSKNAIDEVLPEAPDIEDRWVSICEAYLPDGVREFLKYPTVSLGWMMFMGMAVAAMWDQDWEMYSKFEDLYAILRDGRGYDNMDEYICQDILKLDPEQEKETSDLVGDTASMVYNLLMREGFQPSTPEAFNAYVRCLHQLYYFGAAVELKRLGYHMTEVPLN